MLRAVSFIAGLSLLAGAAAAQTRPDQVKFRELYKELVETNHDLVFGQLHPGGGRGWRRI